MGLQAECGQPQRRWTASPMKADNQQGRCRPVAKAVRTNAELIALLNAALRRTDVCDGVTVTAIYQVKDKTAKGASPLLRVMEAPAIVNKMRSLDINSIPFDELEALPEFIQKKMKSSEEYGLRVRHSGNMEAAGPADEMPASMRDPVPGKLQRPKNIPPAYPDVNINPDDIPF
jgi:hypothetical protein